MKGRRKHAEGQKVSKCHKLKDVGRSQDRKTETGARNGDHSSGGPALRGASSGGQNGRNLLEVDRETGEWGGQKMMNYDWERADSER